MYIYYVLRGTQAGTLTELEGEIDAERFPGVDLGNGPAIITHLVMKLREDGNTGEWTECDLTDYNDRWMRRSDAPWRKDKGV